MKKKLLAGLAIGLLTGGIVGIAHAVPTINSDGDGFEDVAGTAYAYYENSGDLMFVEPGNNSGINFSNGTVEGLVEDWLIDNTSMVEADRVDFILTEATVTYRNWDEALAAFTMGATASGDWAVTPVGDMINFYAVKAAPAYAMYYVDPAEGTGSWSTYDLWNAGYGGNDPIQISHFTGYNSTSTSVPEPATMLLFGTGLIGLAGYRRRQSTKK